jgi:hypothetical protein
MALIENEKHRKVFFWIAISVSLLVNIIVIYRSHTRENPETNKVPIVNTQHHSPAMEHCRHLIGQPASRPPVNPYAPNGYVPSAYRSQTPYERCMNNYYSVTRGGRCDYGVRQCDQDAAVLYGIGGAAVGFSLWTAGSSLKAWAGIALTGAGSVYSASRIRECYRTHCQRRR